MKFKIDLRIFLFIILFYFTKQVQLYLLILLFGFIHELGHLFVGLLLQMKPDSLSIMPLGISVSFKINPKDYNVRIKKGNLFEIKKIMIALAGPVTNGLIIIFASCFKMNIINYFMIVLTNLIILLYNLIPIYPMDGGRILKSFLHIWLGRRKGIEYTHKISYVFLVLLTLAASIGILYLKNFAIFFAIMYLWFVFLSENKFYKSKIKMYEILENNFN